MKILIFRIYEKVQRKKAKKKEIGLKISKYEFIKAE